MSKIGEGRPEGTRKTMGERICETREFLVWSKRPREWQMVRTKMETVMRCIYLRLWKIIAQRVTVVEF